MNCSDIDGAKPKVKKQLAQRDSYNVTDIAGTRPKMSLARKSVHDQTYSDVTAKKVLNRPVHNPCDP